MRVVLEGKVFQDCFGRIFVDRHRSDSEHWAAKTPPDKERLGCRKYVEDLFEELVGKEGMIAVTVEFLDPRLISEASVDG